MFNASFFVTVKPISTSPSNNSMVVISKTSPAGLLKKMMQCFLSLSVPRTQWPEIAGNGNPEGWNLPTKTGWESRTENFQKAGTGWNRERIFQSAQKFLTGSGRGLELLWTIFYGTNFVTTNIWTNHYGLSWVKIDWNSKLNAERVETRNLISEIKRKSWERAGNRYRFLPFSVT